MGTKTNNQKDRLTKSRLHRQASSPAGYITTGLIMWVLGYILGSLAIDSGSILQWIGTIIAFAWGLVRIIQGVFMATKRQRT